VAAIIGGFLGGSAILGLTSGVIVYLIKGRKKDTSEPCININFCTKHINNEDNRNVDCNNSNETQIFMSKNQLHLNIFP
jgi:hypothetical protein